MNTQKSDTLFASAQTLIPGGVNSPVRAFRAVGRSPLFIRRADGAYLYDEDGNAFLDYVMSWGPMIWGHNHPAIREAVVHAAQDGLSFGAATAREVAMARLVTALTGIEMIRMVNSGTEAVMSALRLARGFTNRNKIIKFTDCYHGHCDSMLVKAGSGLLTAGVSSSAGVPGVVAADTLVATYNDAASVKTLLEANPGEVAAVIVEPVCANAGVITPAPDFLPTLRRLCDSDGALLIFDEVITGFRLGLAGAQGYYNVKADLVTYGKIIGGGMPAGAYGGRKEIMECVAPLGPVYQAGTLSGNPLAMAAGLCQLQMLKADPDIYTRLAQKGQLLREGLQQIVQNTGFADARVDGVGSLACLFVGKERYAEWFGHMLDLGVYLAPSQFEAMFLSDAHTTGEIESTLTKIECALRKMVH